jgi:hypothetical protein
MYKTLWNSINKQVKDSHASAAFLSVSLMDLTKPDGVHTITHSLT